MKVLVTGGKGLLAWSIRQLAPADLDLVFWDVEEMDLTQPQAVEDCLGTLRPSVLINTAAYNLVDRCEQERELSWAVNALAPQTLARVCAGLGCRLVHFSSDYVFDGLKQAPYVETDATNPLNHYGAGKLFGETAVLQAASVNLVLRTSWLFGSHPTQAKSYVHSVLRAASAGTILRATTDQVAAPTYAPDLARWVLALVAQGAGGLFHAVNDEGVSRFEWTRAILSQARDAGLLTADIPVQPALTADFNSAIRRPGFSVLDNRRAAARLGGPLGSWRAGLEEMLRAWPLAHQR